MDQEDQLVDYNEYDENGNIVEAPRETAEENSHSPITSPMPLAEDQDEDKLEDREHARVEIFLKGLQHLSEFAHARELRQLRQAQEAQHPRGL